MRRAVWFSRHKPTERQAAELAALGFSLAAVEEGRALGAKALNTTEDVDQVLWDLSNLVDDHNASIVAGVFPTPILNRALQCAMTSMQWGDWPSPNVALWASWNANRSIEGGPPSFEHKDWQAVGILPLPFYRPDPEGVISD